MTMKRAQVYVNGRPAGVLTREDDGTYTFGYDQDYLQDPAASLTLPKREEPYHSEHLFPFFFNMLSEGANKAIQSRILKIDGNDYFTLLLKTAHTDTIGAVTVKEI